MPSAPIDLRPTSQGPKRHGTSRYDALTRERARLRAQREAALAAEEAEAAAWAEDGGKRGGSKKGRKGAAPSPEGDDDGGGTGPRRVVDDDAYAAAHGGAASEQPTKWEGIRAHRDRLGIDEVGADNRATPAPFGPDGQCEPATADVATLSAIEQKAHEAKASVDRNNGGRRAMRMYELSEDHYYARVSGKPGTKR